MSSQPIAREIVDWWLALSGRPPGPEKDDLTVPPPSQVDAAGSSDPLGGRITFNGDYSWTYIRAFTVKMGLWLVNINLGFAITLKLAADFFVKGAEVSISLGSQSVADFVKVKSKVLKEALTLENLQAAAGATNVNLKQARISASEVTLGVTDMIALVDEAEATAEKINLLVQEMRSVVAAQELLISDVRAVGQRSRVGVSRTLVAGNSTSLAGGGQSIDGAAVAASGSVLEVTGDEVAVDGVNSVAAPLVTTLNAHSETG